MEQQFVQQLEQTEITTNWTVGKLSISQAVIVMCILANVTAIPVQLQRDAWVIENTWLFANKMNNLLE